MSGWKKPREEVPARVFVENMIARVEALEKAAENPHHSEGRLVGKIAQLEERLEAIEKFARASIKDQLAAIDFYPIVMTAVNQEVASAVRRIDFSGEKLKDLVAKRLENAILARLQEQGSYKALMDGVAKRLGCLNGEPTEFESKNVGLADVD